MLTAKQNFLETIKADGKPDRLVNQYESFAFTLGDPLSFYIQGERFPGKENMVDRWGTSFIWPENNAFPMPHITEKCKAIRDVATWREFVRVPDLIADCAATEFWADYLERAAAQDAEDKLRVYTATTGISERMHFLMGFEDTLMNFLTEPEAMHDLCDAITEYRLSGFKIICETVKPEVVISHDDWGSKESLFMHPDVWREFIRPGYEKCYGYLKSQGIIVIHHSDSFLEPLVEDMAELGIDVWQGVLPSNDIVRLQAQLNGRMALMGGLDSGVVDRIDTTAEEIYAEVQRACDAYGPAGHYIPSVTYGGPSTLFPGNYEIITEAIRQYNRDHFGME